MIKLPRSFRAPAIALVAAVVASACGSNGTPTSGPGASPTAPATPAPSGTPVPDGIRHPTGARDVVLRMETSGGFAPIEFMATSAPSFTLYGDGTVVFRDPSASPPTSNDNVNRSVPFQTIRLGEDAIQSLLSQAIGPGGLGVAIGPYLGLGADIPSTDFTIAADGRTKTVSVIGLSPEMHPQDAAIVAALAHLGQLLDGFGSAVAGEEPYVAAAFRGVLTPIDQPIGPVKAWPWTTIEPGDFVKGANEFLLTHTLMAADVAALGIDGASGGLQGLTLQSRAKLYSFALRPLLPDEAS
jgi:hypothetical protein